MEKIKVGMCETQPLTSEGVRSVLARTDDLVLTGCSGSLEQVNHLIESNRPDILILDKSLGVNMVVGWISKQHTRWPKMEIVVWGLSTSKPEILRFLQVGVKGILLKNVSQDYLLACLRAVADGKNWLRLNTTPQRITETRQALTAREREVLELVEQGSSNRDIAQQLGIEVSTVKIHIKNISKKTGTHGRFELAIDSMMDKGLLT